jgi:hypothetical protein
MYDIQPVSKVSKTRGERYPFAKLGIDQQFFVPGGTTSLYSHTSTMGKRLGFTLHTRHCWMRKSAGLWIDCTSEDTGSVEGYCVWRSA